MQAPTFSVPPVVNLDPSYKDSLPSWLSPIGSALDSLAARRDALNLPDPGKAEDLGREVKSEFTRTMIRLTLGVLCGLLHCIDADDFLDSFVPVALSIFCNSFLAAITLLCDTAVTHLTNYTFDGARADLSKVLSQVPAFQVTHSFAAGSQGQMGPSPGTYSFGAVYATSQVSFK